MRQTKNPGDIFAIPLPNGRFGFGLCFRASLCGIYQHVGSDINDLPSDRKFLFVTAITKPSLNSADWVVVGKDPVAKSADTHLPRQFIHDEQTGSYSIYEAMSGEITPSTREECVGLEEVAAWSATHVVQRLLSGGKYAWAKEREWLPYGLEYHRGGSFERYDIETGKLR